MSHSARGSAAAAEAAHTWVQRSAPVLRGLTHRFGNGLHALSLVSGEQPDGLEAEDVQLIRDELRGFEALTEQYRALVLALEEEPAACRLEDSLTVALALRAAHVEVRDADVLPDIAADIPAVLAPPTALAQALLLLLLGEHPDGAAAPTVRVHGSAEAAVLEIAGAHDAGEDVAAFAAARWLLRAVEPAVALSWSREGATARVRLSLPSLKASRRASAG